MSVLDRALSIFAAVLAVSSCAAESDSQRLETVVDVEQLAGLTDLDAREGAGVYWASDSGVAVKYEDGRVATISPSPDVCDIALDGDGLFIASEDAIMEISPPEPGGQSRVVYNETTGSPLKCGTLDVQGRLAVVRVASSEYLLVAPEGGTTSFLDVLGGAAKGVQVGGDGVYVLQDEGQATPFKITRFDDTSGQSADLAVERDPSKSLTSFGTRLYWLETPDPASYLYRLTSMATDGTDLRVVAQWQGCGYVSNVAISSDGSRAYVISEMDPCDAVLDLLSIATDGSGVTSLGEAGAFGAARLLTVAGERLYFASGILGDGIYHVEL